MQLVFRALLTALLCALALAFVPISIASAPPQDTPSVYVVQAGDTLFSIALRYNTTVLALKQLNKLGTSDLITVGQKLSVSSTASPATPANSVSASSSYTIQSGDTLYGIAMRYGTTMEAIKNLNGIVNPNLISVGQAIAVPNSISVTKPGLIVDPPVVRQGGTLMIQVARPNLASVNGTFNGKPINFTRATGFWYALVGISRCAKLGAVPLAVTATDDAGKPSNDTTSVTIASTAYLVDAITLPPSKVTILQDTALINREAAQLATIVNKYSPTRLWSGAFRQPLYGTISEFFGTRRSYNGGPVGACGHEGTDFAMPGGTPIYAPARGRVVFAGLTQVRGNMIVIDHGVGVFSAYYHLSAIDTQAGQMVDPGMLIGKVGTTGLSTGNHLHWSMWANGEYVDPMEWTRRIVP
ncbi:MAG: LysM peptidoglycan-binding domain-containing protein [Chloroflexi bacterium]|nr:LysM peptidoglycan-binding domain-containing protein [Chloroflexota bacterium]